MVEAHPLSEHQHTISLLVRHIDAARILLLNLQESDKDPVIFETPYFELAEASLQTKTLEVQVRADIKPTIRIVHENIESALEYLNRLRQAKGTEFSQIKTAYLALTDNTGSALKLLLGP